MTSADGFINTFDCMERGCDKTNCDAALNLPAEEKTTLFSHTIWPPGARGTHKHQLQKGYLALPLAGSLAGWLAPTTGDRENIRGKDFCGQLSFFLSKCFILKSHFY